MNKELFFEKREEEIFPSSTETPIDALSRFTRPVDLSKAAVDGMAELISLMVKDGHVNALDIATRLNWMAQVIEQARDLIREDCIIEIEKHGGRAIINGSEVLKKETGAKYDYKSCGDSVWQLAYEQEAVAAHQRKVREKLLKAVTTRIEVTDELTGEVMSILPPIKSSTTNIQITLK
jgi:hypothetical protein